MAENYSVKINRRDGAIEIAGDKQWVDEKLAQLSDVFTGAIEPSIDERDREASRKVPLPKKQARKQKRETTTGELKQHRRRSGAPTTVRDLDLTPKGKTSLKDFVAEKKPKTNDDLNVVSVYYVSEILGESTVTINHVFTCYKDMRWREPADLANSLAVTTSRKRFLDTADLDDIKLTPAGRNHVQHDLPPEKGD